METRPVPAFRLLPEPAAVCLALALLAPVPAVSAGAEPPGAPWQSAELAGHPLVGRMVDMETGAALSAGEILDRATAAKVVILGERHDNPDHHAIQAWVTRELAARGKRPAIVYEMFETDDQPAIDAYLAGTPADAAGLGAVTGWEKTGWPEWALYQPMADVAVAHDLPVLAGNLPVSTIGALARQGLDAVDPEIVRTLDLRTVDAPPILEAQTGDVRDGHCNLMPEDALGPMVTVQRARDAMMAAKALEGLSLPNTDQAIIITGNGHARRDRGVPLRLQQMGLAAEDIFVLAPLEVQEGLESPAAYEDGLDTIGPAAPFDVAWFTPRLDSIDHCAALRERMQRHKE